MRSGLHVMDFRPMRALEGTTTSTERMGGFLYPGWYALIAVGALLLSFLVALRDQVPSWELRLTEWLNSAPDPIASILYPLMQLGTLAAPVLVAVGILVFKRDRLLAATTIVVGLVSWFGAKAIKQWVERGRPIDYLPNINVREGTGTGLGFISGHSAVVASAVAVMTMAALPRRFRALVLVVALLVGVARVVHGVHLPADVVGGWAFGALIGFGGLWVYDRIAPRLASRG
jgi:glycosyltransferase 2 family protein